MATDSLTDEGLMADIQKGDAQAFAILVKRHSTRYYNLAYRYVVSRDKAEDIVQTAFLKLWENPHRWNLKKGAQFTTWFYRVVVNLCLDRLKKHHAISMPENFDISDETQDQENTLLDLEDKKALAREVAKLPKRQKTAIILCFYEELSHKNAAQVMKINVKALQSLLMRAKTHLKETIAQQDM